jgi:hypothetical protein
MQIGKGFIAGVIAAGVLTLIMAFLRWAGMPVAIELVLGTLVTPVAADAWLAGFGIHLALGGLFGVLYGVVFEFVTGGAGWSIGAALGILHAVIGGALLALLPLFHPLVPERLAAPGPWWSGAGVLGVVSYVALHLVFGAVVGEVYRPVKLQHRRPAAV